MDDRRTPYGDQRVTVDPGTVDLTGELELVAYLPGPAGTAAVDLGGVEVAVDYAEPERVCTITTSLDRIHDPVTEGLLSALIGFEGLELALWSIRTRRDDDRLLQIVLGDPAGRRDRRALGSVPDRQAAEFGRVVAGLAVGTDPHEHPLVRATAFVESAGRLVGLAPGSNWSRRPSLKSQLPVDPALLDRWLTRSAEVLGDHDDLLRTLDRDDHERLHDATSALVRAFGTGAPWVVPLQRAVPRRYYDLGAERDRRRTAADADVGRVAMARSLPPDGFDGLHDEPRAFRFAERTGLDVWSAPEPEPSPRLRLDPPGRLEVRFDAEPGGSWLRVLDAASLALLALVPIVRERGRWTAHAVVPRDLATDRLVVESTDTPLPSGAESSVDRLIEAIDAGRDAAATPQDRAGAEWQRCAGLWALVGDDMRMNRALAYATGRERVGRQPGVHDRIRRLVD